MEQQWEEEESKERVDGGMKEKRQCSNALQQQASANQTDY